MKKTGLLILLFVLSQLTMAQTGLWLKIGAEKAITKKLDIELNFQPRFNTIDWPASSWLAELGAKYNLPKGFDIGLYYRYINRLSNDKKEQSHRFYGDLSYKFKRMKRANIDYRLRFQQQFQDDDTGLISDKNYWRNKVEINFKNKSKIEPSLSADLFYRIGFAFDQVRYKVGMNYKINKTQILDIGIIADDALNSSESAKCRVALAWKNKF